MSERDSANDSHPLRRRRRLRRTAPLDPIPDGDRISSVGTVQAVDSGLESTGPQTSPVLPSAAPGDLPPPSNPDWLVGEEPPRGRLAGPLGRRRAITDVWNGGALDRNRRADHANPPVGHRYRIVEKLGAGGMSEIYRVRHVHMDKEFALKVIDANPTLLPRVRQLFLREAKTASLLDHPNIVQIIDFGVDDELGSFIVMEYLKGETLHSRLGRVGRMKVHQALQIALQVAEALHHMHGEGIIHCDVKAENVFLCRTPAERRQRLHIKMIDFGLSRPRTQHVKLAEVEVGGTPQYMAPELINGESPQPSMDIYALGVLLYEMLTGTVPFVGTMDEIIHQQLHADPPLPSTRMKEPLESRVEAVVMEMLRKAPAERQRSMGQVIFQLRTVMSMYDFPGARSHPTTTTAERPTVARRRPPMHQAMVDQSPFPMFQLDSQARIVYANESFCRFVHSPIEKIRGRGVQDTRLGMVYPSIHTDVIACVKRRGSQPIQRAFSFALRDGLTSSMLCWLKAQLDKRGRVVRVNGYIHPVDQVT